MEKSRSVIIDNDYRNKGYMTETIAGLIHWAKNRNEIKTIKALTDRSNLPSIQVLKKNNFKISEQDENTFTMKYELKKYGC